MNKTRTNLRAIVERVESFDEREAADIADVLAWLESGAEVYRRAKPDVPPKHLVSYVAVVDQARLSVLLLDHVKANLWVPAGGHVALDEDPHETAERELVEELGPRAGLVASVARLPLFVTVTRTRGVGSHLDVSLWYVVAGDERMWIEPDPREFRGHRWQSYQAVLEIDSDELDPEMHRFIRKLQGRV
jgi:8-oxo-dGTP pyrophosphatase MutT (NUDIX family)